MCSSKKYKALDTSVSCAQSAITTGQAQEVILALFRSQAFYENKHKFSL